MGLGLALSNALAGMSINQRTLDTVSRNVANSGTAGYHRQTLTVSERTSGANSSVTATTVTRAFSQALQTAQTRTTADAAYASTRATVLDSLQTYLGTPGSTGSLDTQFSAFSNALQALSVSPDSASTRAGAVSAAQALTSTLNGLTSSIQDLRKQTESEIGDSVQTLNTSLGSLADLNTTFGTSNLDDVSRNNLLDRRDRLLEQIAGEIDIQVGYNADGSVSVNTREGAQLVGSSAAQFQFTSGNISAQSLYSADSGANRVGQLTLSNGGSTIDVVKRSIVSSGKLGALLELRDKTLVDAQGQLDDIAGALSKAMSTSTTAGTAASSNAASGFDLNISTLQAGDDFTLNYSENGTAKTVRVVRVEDASKLPMDTTGADGVRVIGLSFSGGAASVSAQLNNALGSGVSVSNPSGSTLRVLDDGAADTTAIGSLVGHATATTTQAGGLGLPLFVDTGNAAYTGSLDGAGQKLGFAGRIKVNAAVVSDPSLLVKTSAGTATGNAARPNALVEQLGGLQFLSSPTTASGSSGFRLKGNVSDLINQALNYQGSTVAAATDADSAQQQSLQSLQDRLDSTNGVNVDDEMARLMELQNAYAANARVLSIVQELMDTLLKS